MKNEAAMALGKLGGIARAASLSKRRRRQIAKAASLVAAQNRAKRKFLTP